MPTHDPVVPVYPTCAQFWRVPRWGAGWRGSFPFNAPNGRWTFSGRVALYCGLPSLGVPAGSTILVPAYHQGVEIDTLLAAGYDVRYYRLTERLLIDFDDLARRLDHTVSTLYVIHYFGFPQPLAEIRRFCETHRLRLIEDCALSLFSRDDDAWLGSAGDIALFSVYKTLPLPHGGYLVTRDRQAGALRPAPFSSTFVQGLDLLHHALQTTRWRGVERALTRTSRWVAGAIRWDRGRTINSGGARWDPRLLAYGASAWIPWLMHLMDPAEVVARRRRNYEHLVSRLRYVVRLPFPDLPAGVCPLFLPAMVPDKPRFQGALAQLGVQTVDLWDASHPTCPPELARDVSGWRRYCLELPIHQELTREDVDRVADALLAVLRRTPRRTMPRWLGLDAAATSRSA